MGEKYCGERRGGGESERREREIEERGRVYIDSKTKKKEDKIGLIREKNI